MQALPLSYKCSRNGWWLVFFLFYKVPLKRTIIFSVEVQNTSNSNSELLNFEFEWDLLLD